MSRSERCHTMNNEINVSLSKHAGSISDNHRLSNKQSKQKKPSHSYTVMMVACALILFGIVLFSTINYFTDQEPKRNDSTQIVSGLPPTNSAEPRGCGGWIQTSCHSFYPIGERIVLELAMGDTYERNQHLGTLPCYDTYGDNGYPLLFVTDAEDLLSVLPEDTGHPWGAECTRADSKMVINGLTGYYERVFTKDEMRSLDTSKNEYDIESYLHQMVEIDASALRIGDHGLIHVGFGWVFPKDNPDNYKAIGPTVAGWTVDLGYYVSEDGVALSLGGWEEAQELLSAELD